MSAKQKAIDLLKRVKAARNVHREKPVAVKEELKDVKKKNIVLSKMFSAEKTKSTEINHHAWLDKKDNLTLLPEATNSHQAELEKQQGDTKEKLRDERRRINEIFLKTTGRERKKTTEQTQTT